MSMFGNLTSDGLEESQDRLGGFQVWESDAYTGTIKAAYGTKSKNGAKGFVIHFDKDGKEYRETLWVTNKAGENFYVDKNDGNKKKALAGFTIADDICMVTTEKPLKDQTFEDKIMNVYDPDQKKEVPTSVPMAVDLIGKTVTLGILKELQNKNAQDASGAYVATAETREVNAIDKVFHHPTNLTMVEVRNGIRQAQFLDAWVTKNKGVTRDRREIKDGGQAGKAGRPNAGPPAAGANGAAKTPSLFG